MVTTRLPERDSKPLLPDHDVRLREIYVHRWVVRRAERPRCEPGAKVCGGIDGPIRGTKDTLFSHSQALRSWSRVAMFVSLVCIVL